MTLRPAAAALSFALGATAIPAFTAAAPLLGPHLAARIGNAEFRGYATTSRGFENQIWHFLPDGRVRAVAESRKLVAKRDDYRQEWQDIGAWRLTGTQVCVEFQGPNRNLNGCYGVEAGPRNQARLVGPVVWQGTLEAYE